jgi:hypothetical protein
MTQVLQLPPSLPASAGAASRRHERRIHLRPERAERISAPAGDHGVGPGSAERAEEWHVSFVESLLPENCQP